MANFLFLISSRIRKCYTNNVFRNHCRGEGVALSAFFVIEKIFLKISISLRCIFHFYVVTNIFSELLHDINNVWKLLILKYVYSFIEEKLYLLNLDYVYIPNKLIFHLEF